MPNPKYILLTRPDEDAKNFARQVDQQIEPAGFKSLVEPMLKIRKLDFTLPGLEPYEALVFTSTNAVRQLPAGFRPDIPVYCVGDRTAAELKNRGFRRILSAAGTVADLNALLQTEKALKGKKLLHIRGEHTAGQELTGTGISIEKFVVYTAEPTKNLSPECTKALSENTIAAALFFSTRTALTFVEILEKANALKALQPIKLLCISDAVLQSVRSYGWSGTYTAKSPDGAGMLALVKSVI